MKKVKIEDWCCFCMRIGYDDVTPLEGTNMSICEKDREVLDEIYKQRE